MLYRLYFYFEFGTAQEIGDVCVCGTSKRIQANTFTATYRHDVDVGVLMLTFYTKFDPTDTHTHNLCLIQENIKIHQHQFITLHTKSYNLKSDNLQQFWLYRTTAFRSIFIIHLEIVQKQRRIETIYMSPEYICDSWKRISRILCYKRNKYYTYQAFGTDWNSDGTSYFVQAKNFKPFDWISFGGKMTYDKSKEPRVWNSHR